MSFIDLIYVTVSGKISK